MKTYFIAFLSLALAAPALSQPAASDDVQAAVILIRHGVRAPLASEIRGNVYNAQPWPAWQDDTGVLTKHGGEALRLIGAWYRNRYASILPAACDPASIYTEANGSQRTIASAKSLLEGIAPDCTLETHVRPAGQSNPLFGPASVSQLADPIKLANAIQGRLGQRLDWWTRAFANPLEEMRHVLLDCAGADCDKAKPIPATATAVVAPAPGTGIVNVDGPVAIGADFAEHFLLQYTEGFPMEKVGWGRVSRASLDRLMEMNTRYHDFVLRTPYYAQIAGSALADRIDKALEQAAQPGSTKARLTMLVGHDSNLAWLGGLLRTDWLLPDQTFNATSPGSALVFELLKSQGGGEPRVRLLFVSQTLDQIRFLKPLQGAEQPAAVPVFIPGCSADAADYSCSLSDFSHTVQAAIDKRFLAPVH